MRVRDFQCETIVPARIPEVFRIFADAENLERLTPEWLRFEILTPRPIVIGPGAKIDYRLRLLGIPFHWQTEITVWEPGVRFLDVQRRGPYRLWEHEHSFQPHPKGTKMLDKLRYAVPGGPLEPLITRIFFRKQIEKIFGYRSDAIRNVFT